MSPMSPRLRLKGPRNYHKMRIMLGRSALKQFGVVPNGLPSPTFWGQFWKKVLTGPCPFVSLVSMNESQARKARKQLLRELPDPTEILRGSLLDRRIFHRRGCRKCRRGEGHRVWVLTVGYPGGRTRQFTVPAEHKGQVQRWLRNYRKLRAKLEAICELNHELLRADL